MNGFYLGKIGQIRMTIPKNQGNWIIPYQLINYLISNLPNPQAQIICPPPSSSAQSNTNEGSTLYTVDRTPCCELSSMTFKSEEEENNMDPPPTLEVAATSANLCLLIINRLFSLHFLGKSSYSSSFNILIDSKHAVYKHVEEEVVQINSRLSKLDR